MKRESSKHIALLLELLQSWDFDYIEIHRAKDGKSESWLGFETMKYQRVYNEESQH